MDDPWERIARERCLLEDGQPDLTAYRRHILILTVINLGLATGDQDAAARMLADVVKRNQYTRKGRQ